MLRYADSEMVLGLLQERFVGPPSKLLADPGFLEQAVGILRMFPVHEFMFLKLHSHQIDEEAVVSHVNGSVQCEASHSV